MCGFYFTGTLNPMEPKNQERLDELESKINQILFSVKKTEKYMRLTFWVTIVVFVLPLLLLAIAIPSVISSYTAALEGLV